MQKGLGRRELTIAGVTASLGLPGAIASPLRTWTMPTPPSPIAPARHFERQLFELALTKAGWPHQVQMTPSLSWRRQMREMQLGRVDVAPLPATSNEDAAGRGLLRVDFALRGGLLGVRRLLALRSRVDALAGLSDLPTLLRDHTLGYGTGWADLPQMQGLGVRLRTAATLPELYDMLRRGEVDYLSRGLNEIDSELSLYARGEPAIAVVPGLVLHYPLDDCFFVAPRHTALHAALSEGLLLAQRDGSHAALLREHYGAQLEQLQGARTWLLTGYPVPKGLPPEQFEVWQKALSSQPPARRQARRTTLRVAVGEQHQDLRKRFALRLLDKALERAGRPFDLVPRPDLSPARQWLELEQGQLDVCELPAQPPLKGVTSHRVPVLIHRGLLGVRLLLARSDRAAELAALPDFASLRAGLRFGHGSGWGDLGQMQSAGLRLVTRSSHAELFRLLEAGGCDVMSRSVAEVWSELADPRLAGSGLLQVVPRLALHFPLDECFWVTPKRPELAEAIATGLQAMQADGSFDELLRERYGPDLQRAGLAQRVIWRLPGVMPPSGMEAALFDGWQSLVKPSAVSPLAR